MPYQLQSQTGSTCASYGTPPIRMARVPFGVNCSPYILQATIQHHLQVCVERRNLTVEMFAQLTQALYMDDLIASFPSIHDKEKFIQQSTETFAAAGMTVHKWKGSVDSPTSESRSSNVLGVLWDRYEDTLALSPPDNATSSSNQPVTTKHQFLSLLASIFDP